MTDRGTEVKIKPAVHEDDWTHVDRRSAGEERDVHVGRVWRDGTRGGRRAGVETRQA